MKRLKDKRIQILGIDEATEQKGVIAEVWAHFRSMSVKEGFNCGADFAWNNVYFTISRPDPNDFALNTYNEIRYNGNDYEIVGIDLFEDKPGSDIRIQARCRY